MSRVKKLRIGAALAGVTVTAMMASVTPASAGSVTGKIDKTADVNGPLVLMDGMEVDTKLIGLRLDGDKGDTIQTYCVQIEQDIDDKGPGYIEADWNKHPQKGSPFHDNSAKINWVLHNGYPNLKAEKLAEKVKGDFENGLSVAEAIAGTQAAVWHFSDNRTLKDVLAPKKDYQAKADKKDVFRVYEYLTKNAGEGISTEPKPVLNLEPNKLTGKADSLIGPYVVTTTAKDITIAAKLPEGVIFSDKNGTELPKADVAQKIQQLDKYEFYVKVPASVATGKVEFTVSGESEFSLGRLFISKVAEKKSQSLILAKTENVRLSASGTAEWGAAPNETPKPQPKPADNELANTGASVLMPLIIGVVLVGGGVGALVFNRRRRKA
ncbi:thioester domain-containing protein [Kibdelosporangium philippinense]|uniref:Thioester domain-containing protein n=1 Tax=Kibdelosporangium philippinense TaxID=211113 RepID=A0ABS8ZPF8_9PSEU|nr:thioester domain-containing protein [Kibdelosporangium philippinense]MCE7009459.1 thioester domain-containing protein [Kibdelosporangium philippinense]